MKKYTFESFVVGDSNKFVHAVCVLAAEMPSLAYNPIYIHGASGLGKTHLMYSIKNHINKTHPEKQHIYYVTVESLTNDVIDAIRNGTSTELSQLRNKYRTCDLLLVDGAQFLIGKEATQKEFLDMFNTLLLDKKQIVIASDCSLEELPILSQIMNSPYASGFVGEIFAPSYDLRMAFLRKKVAEFNVVIGDLILEYIATNIRGNIGELEGALTKIVARSCLIGEEVSLEAVQRELDDYIKAHVQTEITP